MTLSLWSLILGWLFTAAIVGANGLVIYLITTRRKLRTTTNWFVLSLAVADFGVGLTYFPRYSICRIYHTCFTDTGNIAFSVQVFCHCASVASLCALTLDRYLAIVNPLRYVVFMTKKRVLTLLTTAWSTAMLVFISCLASYLIKPEKTRAILKIVLWMCIAFVSFVVCLWLLFATSRIFLVARRIARNNAALNAQLNFNYRTQYKMSKARETKTAKLVGVLVGVFLVCYLLDIVETILMYGFSIPLKETLGMLVLFLVLVNSAVNPVVYTLLRKEIKRELMGLRYTVRTYFPQTGLLRRKTRNKIESYRLTQSVTVKCRSPTSVHTSPETVLGTVLERHSCFHTKF